MAEERYSRCARCGYPLGFAIHLMALVRWYEFRTRWIFWRAGYHTYVPPSKGGGA